MLCKQMSSCKRLQVKKFREERKTRNTNYGNKNDHK